MSDELRNKIAFVAQSAGLRVTLNLFVRRLYAIRGPHCTSSGPTTPRSWPCSFANSDCSSQELTLRNCLGVQGPTQLAGGLCTAQPGVGGDFEDRRRLRDALYAERGSGQGWTTQEGA